MSRAYSEIVGTGYYLPKRIVTNEDLSHECDTSDEWIRTRTGIAQRHFADVQEGTSDLACHAAAQAMADAGMAGHSVDLIIACTHSPDYYFPGIGVLLQKKLKCASIPAIDIRDQCSGFSHGLSVADAMIKADGFSNALVVGAEIHSRFLDFSYEGRSFAVLMGDGAGALVLSRKETADRGALSALELSAVYGHELGSDGDGCDALIMRTPGNAAGNPRFAGIGDEPLSPKMFVPDFNGPLLFKHAVERMAYAAEKILRRFKLTADDIDVVVPHQANLRIVSKVAEKLCIPLERCFLNLASCGNTGGASIPIALAQALEEGAVRKGQLILLLSFGSGFTWGANLLRL